MPGQTVTHDHGDAEQEIRIRALCAEDTRSDLPVSYPHHLGGSVESSERSHVDDLRVR